ncbi:MAG: SAM-dependent methyltransferase [Clostridia bacterium]|nr:SAM-dependent methyltransferase [Clostridia bacterium]
MKNTENTASSMETLLSLLKDCAEKQALKKAVLSRPLDKTVQKTVLTPRVIGGKLMLQAESFLTDNKAVHQNIAPDDTATLEALLSSYLQINLLTTAGDCELKRSKSGTETLLGAKPLLTKLSSGETEKLAARGNNNEKTHILSGAEPFLKLLGVSDANGRVLDRKRSKFRQINRFLEHIRDVLPELDGDGALHVADLCCGKSYLSFAAYHYFSVILGRPTEMYCVDLKRDVIEYCADAAEMLGFTGLHFLCADITDFTPPTLPSLVISLHACDTATDVVLAKAMEWKAKVILSTPCCHHELNHTINCAPLAFVTEHSMLRQKLCDAATDALRLKLLEANGYSVCALELIDPEETPKNVLLRALRKKPSPQAEAKARREYEAARAFLLGQ